jgi:DNA-binding XRE family transcriptional regulator
MTKKKLLDEADLAQLAKEFRLAAGKTKVAVASELGVKHPAIVHAEENMEQSMLKLRIRMIEKYSPYKVIGPVFLLKKK